MNATTAAFLRKRYGMKMSGYDSHLQAGDPGQQDEEIVKCPDRTCPGHDGLIAPALAWVETGERTRYPTAECGGYNAERERLGIDVAECGFSDYHFEHTQYEYSVHVTGSCPICASVITREI
jgi:hypothetical protein